MLLHKLILKIVILYYKSFHIKNKEFNTIKYTTFIWSYETKYDYFMTEQVV